MKTFAHIIKEEGFLILIGSTGAVCMAAGVFLGAGLLSFGAPPGDLFKLSVFAGVFVAVGSVCLIILVRHTRKHLGTVRERLMIAAVSPPSEGTRHAFAEIEQEWDAWEKEHAMCSMPTEHESPTWPKTLAMGWVIVPLILEALADHPRWWMLAALHQITKACPFPEKDAGRFPAMIKAWLRWGRENGHIVPKTTPQEHLIG